MLENPHTDMNLKTFLPVPQSIIEEGKRIAKLRFREEETDKNLQTFLEYEENLNKE